MSTPNKIKAASWLQDELQALQTDPTFVAEDIILDVTEQLHVHMEAKGISQTQLAERLGVSRSAVSQLMSGNQNVSIRRLVEVALVLGMTLIPPRFVPLQPAQVEAVDDHGMAVPMLETSMLSGACRRSLWSHAMQPKQEVTVVSQATIGEPLAVPVNDYSHATRLPAPDVAI